MLYDQSYKDNKRLRVTVPFTGESLSPHRALPADQDISTSEGQGQQQMAGRFQAMIVKNLRKAGVQNTRQKERLKFDQLEPYAGV